MMITTKNALVDPIKKEDMITIKVIIDCKELLWKFLGMSDLSEKYWIIKYETKDKEIILSCVNSQSRDELFELLVENIANNT